MNVQLCEGDARFLRIALLVGLQALVIYAPFMQTVFDTAPLSGRELALAASRGCGHSSRNRPREGHPPSVRLSANGPSTACDLNQRPRFGHRLRCPSGARRDDPPPKRASLAVRRAHSRLRAR